MVSSKGPLDELEEFFDRIGRQFQEATDFSKENQKTQKEVSQPPDIDLIEKEKNFIVVVDIPGFEEDEIDIEITETTLKIKGKHKKQQKKQEGKIIKKERTEKSQKRYIYLPKSIDKDKSSAELKNGILKITLPKKKKTKIGGKKIDIEKK